LAETLSLDPCAGGTNLELQGNVQNDDIEEKREIVTPNRVRGKVLTRGSSCPRTRWKNYALGSIPTKLTGGKRTREEEWLFQVTQYYLLKNFRGERISTERGRQEKQVKGSLKIGVNWRIGPLLNLTHGLQTQQTVKKVRWLLQSSNWVGKLIQQKSGTGFLVVGW